jgi:hypothetical protein
MLFELASRGANNSVIDYKYPARVAEIREMYSLSFFLYIVPVVMFQNLID